MKSLIILSILIITPSWLYPNDLDCSCEKNETIEENKYDCDVLEFKNGTKLYW